jgi:hypothetical protein
MILQIASQSFHSFTYCKKIQIFARIKKTHIVISLKLLSNNADICYIMIMKNIVKKLNGESLSKFFHIFFCIPHAHSLINTKKNYNNNHN